MALPPEGATVGRQSTFGDMQLCPARRKYVDHPLYIRPLGASLLVGDSLHYMIARHLTGAEPKDVIDGWDEWVETHLFTEYEWEVERIPNFGALRKEIVDAYRLWIFQVWMPVIEPQLTPLYAETELYMPLDESNELWLRGTPDLTLVHRMFDWKTAKSNRQWDQAKVNYALQTSLYLLLHNYVFEANLHDFSFAVFNRQASEWVVYPTERSSEEIEAARLTALEYVKQIRAEAYPATPVVSEYSKRKRGWYCSTSWCPAWNACEHKFMNDGTDTTAVAIREWR